MFRRVIRTCLPPHATGNCPALLCEKICPTLPQSRANHKIHSHSIHVHSKLLMATNSSTIVFISTKDSATSISPVLFGAKQCFFEKKKWQVAYSGLKCISKTFLNKIQTFEQNYVLVLLLPTLAGKCLK